MDYCCFIILSCLGDSEMLHQQFMSALSEWGARTLWDEGES